MNLEKNLRVAFPIQHKNDSVSSVANTIVHGDFANESRRYIYAVTADNDVIELHDANTDDISDTIKNIFDDSVEDRELDSELYNPYSLIFIVKRDSEGNKTLASREEIIPKLKSFRKEHISKFKPYQFQVNDDGMNTRLIPFLNDEMVFTEIRFQGDTSDYRDIGHVMETLLEKFINIENNLTTQIMIFYDNCMRISHKLHLLDVNQDTKIIEIFNDVASIGGFEQAIRDWIPELEAYSSHPTTHRIDLSTSDRNYMYQYKIEDVAVKDTNPLLRSSIKCLANTTPKVYADLESGYRGGLHSMLVNKSHQEDWVERVEEYDLNLSWSNTMKFTSNPQTPSITTSELIGSPDQLPNKVDGTMKLSYKTDVPVDAMITNPWLQMDIECYNTNGTYIKTVTATWDDGSTQRKIPFNGLTGTYKFTANLAGNYRVKYKPRIYWGTFGAWTDEVEIAYWGLARGNNSGGTWKMNPYIFNNQSNRVLTRVQLIDASKYEKNVIINGRGYGWGTTFNPPLTWEQNNTFSAPGSANYWYARFYGKFFDKPGCDLKRVEWNNVRKTREVDMSSSMHYNGTAQNYGILTQVVINLNSIGMKAHYYDRKSNRPYIYPSVSGEHTFMLRGGYQYDVLTDAKEVKLTQTGVYKVEERTFEFEQNNTFYQGASLILENDLVIVGTQSTYNMNIGGSDFSTGVISSTPRELFDSTRRKRALIDNNYPNEEKGLGQLYRLPLNDMWGLHKSFYLVATLPDKSILRVNLSRDLIFDNEWCKVYDVDGVRIYVYKTDNEMSCVIYGLNVTILRLYYEDEQTLRLQLTDQSGEVKFSSNISDEGDIPIMVNDKKYYVEMDKYEPTIMTEVKVDRDVMLIDDELEIQVIFNKSDEPEIVVKDNQGNIVGVIRK